MYTEQSVDIRGEVDRVWELASAVERWPRILPHYRYVSIIQQRDAPARRIVEMAAWRSGLPIRWLAVVESRPDEHRLLFHHLGGAARGMDVEWRLVPTNNGVRVILTHALASPYAIIRSRLGEYILGEQVVAYVAGRTLARIKALVEQERVVAGASRGRW